METYVIIQRRVEALHAKNIATPYAERAGNDAIVREAMELYQFSKQEYFHWGGKGVRSACAFAIGIATTFGLSSIVSVAFLPRNCDMCQKWQDLENRCKEIGEYAARYANVAFIRRSESPLTVIRPILMGSLFRGDQLQIGGDVADFVWWLCYRPAMGKFAVNITLFDLELSPANQPNHTDARPCLGVGEYNSRG